MNTRSAAPSVLVAVAAGVFVVTQARIYDYAYEAGPALAALVAGHLRHALSVPFYMGLFAILVRAPFVWVATRLDAGPLAIYRVGVVPCVAAAAILGVILARPRRQSQGWLLVVPILAVLSPPALNAVRLGHPEQILCGALAVAAVLLALAGRGTFAGVALGLAIATKQDAVIAVVPVLLASRAEQRLRVAIVGAATAAVFYGFMLVVAPHALLGTTSTLAHTRVNGKNASPEAVWFAFAHAIRIHVDPTLTRYRLSPLYGSAGRTVSVLAQLPLGYLVWRRRGAATSPLALLALLMLIRCILDPIDFDYFHVPFFLALLAWEVYAGRLVRGVPPGSLVAVLFLWLTFGVVGPQDYVRPWPAFALYIAWAAGTAIYLMAALELLPGRILKLRSHVSPVNSKKESSWESESA